MSSEKKEASEECQEDIVMDDFEDSPIKKSLNLLEIPSPDGMNEYIPMKIQSGFRSVNVSIMHLDTDGGYMFFGTDAGCGFLYNRETGELIKVSSENRSGSIESVKLFIGIECQCALGSSEGKIDITIISNGSAPNTRQVQKFALGNVHQAKITCMEWSANGMKLFSGDTTGSVYVIERDFEKNECNASMVVKESQEIVGLSYRHMILLVSTTERSVLIHTNREEKQQIPIGSKNRQGVFGACFSPDSVTSSELQVFCARPGYRIWIADIDGRVTKTLLFKDLVSSTHCKIELIDSSDEITAKDQQFRKLMFFQNKYLLAYSGTSIFIVDTAAPAILASCQGFPTILNVSVTRNEIFVLCKNRDLRRLAEDQDQIAIKRKRLEEEKKSETAKKLKDVKDSISGVRKNFSPLVGALQSKMSSINEEAGQWSQKLQSRAKVLHQKLPTIGASLFSREDKNKTASGSDAQEKEYPLAEETSFTSPNSQSNPSNAAISSVESDVQKENTGTPDASHQSSSSTNSVLDKLEDIVDNDDSNEIVFQSKRKRNKSKTSPNRHGSNLNKSSKYSKNASSSLSSLNEDDSKRKEDFEPHGNKQDSSNGEKETEQYENRSPSTRLQEDISKFDLNSHINPTNTEEHPSVTKSQTVSGSSYVQTQGSIQPQENAIVTTSVPSSVLEVANRLNSVAIPDDETIAKSSVEHSSALPLSSDLRTAVSDDVRHVSTPHSISKHTPESSQKEEDHTDSSAENTPTKNGGHMYDGVISSHPSNLNGCHENTKLDIDITIVSEETKSHDNLSQGITLKDSGMPMKESRSKDDASNLQNDNIKESTGTKLQNLWLDEDGDASSDETSESESTTFTPDQPWAPIAAQAPSNSDKLFESDSEEPKSFDSLDDIYAVDPATKDFESELSSDEEEENSVDQVPSLSLPTKPLSTISPNHKVFRGNVNVPVKLRDLWCNVSLPHQVFGISAADSFVWYIDHMSHIYLTEEYGGNTSSAIKWRKLAKRGSKLCISPSGDVMWLIGLRGNVYAAAVPTELDKMEEPLNFFWEKVSSKIANIALGHGTAWAVTHSGIIKSQCDLSRSRPYTTTWNLISWGKGKGKVSEIVVTKGTVWCKTDQGILYKTDIETANARDAVWKRIPGPGKPSSVSSTILNMASNGSDSIFAVDGHGILWFLTEDQRWWQVNISEYVEEKQNLFTNVSQSLPGNISTPLHHVQRWMAGPIRCQYVVSNNQSVWVIHEKFKAMIARGPITGNRWELASPLGVSKSSTWKHITTSSVFSPDYGSWISLIWASRPNGEIFCFQSEDVATKHPVPLPPPLLDNSQILCMSACKDALWVLYDNGEIFIRSGVTTQCMQGTNWCHLDTKEQLGSVKLVYLSCGTQNVWAVGSEGQIFFRMGVAAVDESSLPPAWIPIEGCSTPGHQFLQIESGLCDSSIWAIDNFNEVYVRTGVTLRMPVGTGWELVPGSHANQLCISNHTVWGLRRSGNLIRRFGISDRNPMGNYWKKVRGKFNKIAASPYDELWAIDESEHLRQLTTAIYCPLVVQAQYNYDETDDLMSDDVTSPVCQENEWEFV